jgi:hypothetical protein
MSDQHGTKHEQLLRRYLAGRQLREQDAELKRLQEALAIVLVSWRRRPTPEADLERLQEENAALSSDWGKGIDRRPTDKVGNPKRLGGEDTKAALGRVRAFLASRPVLGNELRDLDLITNTLAELEAELEHREMWQVTTTAETDVAEVVRKSARSSPEQEGLEQQLRNAIEIHERTIADLKDRLSEQEAELERCQQSLARSVEREQTALSKLTDLDDALDHSDSVRFRLEAELEQLRTTLREMAQLVLDSEVNEE